MSTDEGTASQTQDGEGQPGQQKQNRGPCGSRRRISREATLANPVVGKSDELLGPPHGVLLAAALGANPSDREIGHGKCSASSNVQIIERLVIAPVVVEGCWIVRPARRIKSVAGSL